MVSEGDDQTQYLNNNNKVVMVCKMIIFIFMAFKIKFQIISTCDD